jgi:hypothetical protein
LRRGAGGNGLTFEGRLYGDRARHSIDIRLERYIGNVLKLGCRGSVVQREFVLLVSWCWGGGGVGSGSHDVLILRSMATT